MAVDKVREINLVLRHRKTILIPIILLNVGIPLAKRIKTPFLWNLFVHTLGRDKDIRANKAALPKVLNRNLALILHPIKQQSSKNLAEITDLIQDSKRRRRLASQIEKAAEVSQTKNWDATR